MATKAPPQAFISSYPPRLRLYSNALLIPVTPSTTTLATSSSRTTKRGTTSINYAEDGYDYDDDDDDGGRRRKPTGLRSLRPEDPNASESDMTDKFGKETLTPVEVQGIWREWMGKMPSYKTKSDLQNVIQVLLPEDLIPIRIEIDIPAFTPQPPLPLPTGPAYNTIDPQLPVYKVQETTPAYRLKDTFKWNLWEALITTDQFAQTMVQELDLPNKLQVSMEISKQIRTQLEEYASIALQPLFRVEQHQAPQPSPFNATPVNKATTGLDSRNGSATPAYSGSATPAFRASTPTKQPIVQDFATATATRIPDSSNSTDYNVDDSHRCIIDLNVNILNEVYSDKFEWSLQHPPTAALTFAKVICADMGLKGEWAQAISHAICDAVWRVKKDACETGVLPGDVINFPNQALNGVEGGWRFDPESLGAQWQPRIETLSKEEIEKREGDRERQIRRQRRETARFSGTATLSATMSTEPQEEERMGRGERSKKKRRFRSLTPETPGGRGTPSIGGIQGYGHVGASMTDYERSNWRCTHCKTWGTAVWAVRDGPEGPKTLCNNCSFLFEQDRRLPPWLEDMHKSNIKPSEYR